MHIGKTVVVTTVALTGSNRLMVNGFSQSMQPVRSMNPIVQNDLMKPLMAKRSERSDGHFLYRLRTRSKEHQAKQCASLWFRFILNKNDMKSEQSAKHKMAVNFSALPLEQQVRFYVFHKLVGDRLSYGDMDSESILPVEHCEDVDALIERALSQYNKQEVNKIAQFVWCEMEGQDGLDLNK